mgnify:CR=1 FL=1
MSGIPHTLVASPSTRSYPGAVELKNCLVFVDVGNEIDDEQLINFIEDLQVKLDGEAKLRSKDKTYIRLHITVVFCGFNKLSDTDSMKRWLTEFKYPDNVVPCCVSEAYQKNLDVPQISFTDGNSKCGAGGPLLFYMTFAECTKMISESKEPFKCDYILVCASMRGWKGENLSVEKKLFFQGNLTDVTDENGKVISPKGLNAVGSEDFINFHKEKLQDNFHVIGSDRCAQMRPTGRYLNSLPEHFKIQTAEAGFKLLVGRIMPGITLPNGIELSKKIAAGLLNPDCGRGANWNAMKSFAYLIGIDIDNDFEPGTGRLYNKKKFEQSNSLAERYFIQIYDINLHDEGDALETLPSVIWYNDYDNETGKIVRKSLNWGKEQTLNNLTRMHLCFDYICPGIWDGCEQPFYSTFTLETIDESLSKLRSVYLSKLEEVEEDVVIGFLNPTYDLFLGYVFYSYLCHDEDQMQHALTKADPVEFFKCVST